ncbi:MAG: aminotransferase class III-fold pyridoxal phosphate-dependent enzyme, partial [Pseudomonadota bacterium]
AELESTIAEIGAENIACFIAEPIIGAGGVIVAPEGYHKRALEICRAHDILYISDEVVTAFGRLGHIFASEPKFEIVPDIIICAKGISSGYIPLGATIFSDKIHEGISQPKSGSGVFSHGFTYSGHPVACAVGLKNIEIMEREDICAHAAKVGATFQARLASLSDLKLVGDVRGDGLMAGVELVQDKASKTPFDPAVAITKRVAKAAYQRGLVVRAAGDVMVMSPPLIISEEQVEELVETLKASLHSVAEGMK